MKTEFSERGLLSLYGDQKRWLRDHWPEVVTKNFAPSKRTMTTRRSVRIPKPFWFIG